MHNVSYVLGVLKWLDSLCLDKNDTKLVENCSNTSWTVFCLLVCFSSRDYFLHQVMLLWSLRWRWFLWCNRRHGRRWSTTSSHWCVWHWCPLSSAWWDFISTRRPTLRSPTRRRQRTRRARRNDDQIKVLFK